MSRHAVHTLAFALVTAIALPACHEEAKPVVASEADLPPLPPSSGTPIGYLLDARDQLKLSSDQLAKLKKIDSSLAARDAEIDTELREIEQPPAPDDPKQHDPTRHVNNAPGASGPPTGNAARLHELKDKNDHDAIQQAWALLDASQQATAKQILEDRGVAVPGDHEAAAPTSDDGTPVPGLVPQ